MSIIKRHVQINGEVANFYSGFDNKCYDFDGKENC